MSQHNFSIVIPELVREELVAQLLVDPEEESAAFLLAGVCSLPKETRLLTRRIVVIPRHLYRRKLSYHLEIAPEAINGLAGLCDSSKLTAILCHSHPSSTVLSYSSSDNHGERRLADFLFNVNAGAPVGSLLFGKDQVKGRVWLSSRPEPIPISTIKSIGDIIHYQLKPTQESCMINELTSRQVLLLGEEGQAILASSTIGVVGCGGTGSCVAEQLARLGIGNIMLIDDDDLELSNVSRMYGTYPHQLKRSPTSFFAKPRLKKVDAVKSHLRKIRPDLKVEAISGNVVHSPIARRLLECDAIMLCTDDHWGRSIVNQLSYQYLIPVINMGVRVDAPTGTIEFASGDVHTLGPGKPCLWCYDYLRPERISSESLLPEERATLESEGYVEGIATAPMVISLTSTVASLAVTELLHVLTGFRSERSIKRLKWDILEGNLTRGTVQESRTCVCKKFVATGDLTQLPTTDDERFITGCRRK